MLMVEIIVISIFTLPIYIYGFNKPKIDDQSNYFEGVTVTTLCAALYLFFYNKFKK